MEKIVGIFHLLLFIICTIYPYLFKRNWVDAFYLLSIFGSALSWTIFNGECIISLVLKKWMNPHYKMGENISSDEMYEVLGKEYKTYVSFFVAMLTIIQAYGIYLVLNRNQLNGFYVVFTLLYLIGTRLTNNILLKYVFFFIFSYIIYNILHKLWI
jgi:hypothetical protein